MVFPSGVRALNSVSLEVPQGQMLAVLGASGSGKTTLLKVLSKRLVPSLGGAFIQGKVATIHQDLRLVKQRTVLENVLQGCLARHGWTLLPAGFPKSERERAAGLLKRVGLEHRAGQRVSRLSGGEQQRVAIARALMQDPAILLADEPIASLDPANAMSVMRLLQEVARENNLTVITVMHDSRLAEAFSDRIVGLDQGRLFFDSSREQDRGQSYSAALGAQPDAGGAPQAVAPVVSKTSIWAQYARTGLWIMGGLALLAWGASVIEFDPERHFGALGRVLDYFKRMVPTSMEQWSSLPWRDLFWALVETMQMSIVGTFLAVLLSWPLAALGAKNLCPGWVTRPTRLLLNVVRTIPSLIWALIFVSAVGLGPFAGVLALACYSVGYLTKFFYEAFEAIDPGPSDALGEMGASGLQKFMFAVWPSARPQFYSSCIFMLEYNVRAASVLGIVGAGGIGYYIKLYVDMFDHRAVFASLLLLLTVVVALDWTSTRLRAWLVSA